MKTAVRRHITAGITLAAASAIAVAPIAPPPPTPPAIDVAKMEVRLANSIFNIPTNLFNAIANIPYSEVQAVNQLSASLFFTGNWFAPSATNILGTDPGDPGHYESLVNVLLPLPALSNVLGHQLAMIATAELPANEACDVEDCSPFFPTDPITGVTGLDWDIQALALLTGLRRHPLFDSWLKVPLSELLSGYTFPTVVSPSPGVGENGAVPAGFGWEGTYIDPVTGENVMPWSGTTFKWDPLLPLKSFYDSLTADPDTTGVFGTGIHVPSLTEIGRAFQALLAGLVVDFNPFVPGNPPCPGFCTPATTSGITTPGIVKFISDVWPGNPLIEKWLDLEKNGLANGTTPEQVPILVKILQQPVFTLKPDTLAAINASLVKIHPLLPRLAADSGLLGTPDRDALTKDLNELFGIDPPSDTTPTDGTSSDTTPTALLASLTQKTTSQAGQPVSATSIPSLTPNAVTLDVKATPVEADSEVTTDVSTLTEKASESIEPSADGAAVNADAAPSNAVPTAGQTLETASEPVEKPAPTTTTATDTTATDTTSTDATTEGGPAASGKADGDGTKSGGGLTNGAKAGNGVTGSDDGDTGGGKPGEGNAAGKHRAGKSDAGKGDAGKSDAGKSDAGKGDAGKSDAGKGDAGKSDAGKSGQHRAE